MIGRQLNLTKARQLSLDGDLEGLQSEILKQVGSEAEFNALNTLQRQSLAKAVNYEVGDLQKLVSRQKESVSLAGELAKQDISVSEDAIVGTAKLINNLKAIGMELAETYGPVIEGLVQGIASFVIGLQQTIGIID